MATTVSPPNTEDQVLHHVLHNVLGYPDKAPIYHAFDQFEIQTIDDFLAIRPQ